MPTLRENFPNREKIPNRLGHFLLVHPHEAVVHPEAGEVHTRRTARLRDLVLMVRENEVFAAAMNIERLREMFHRHGGAFDMPAGASAPPRALPRRFSGLG